MDVIKVPEELKRAVENFKKLLKEEERVTIYHDTDPDGIVAGALLEGFLQERGINTRAYAKDRKDVRFQPGNVYVVADIRIDSRILEEMKRSKARVYYIDHHEPDGITENTVVLNPWLTEDSPVNPYKYNTALLAWLLEGMRKENEWKVAAAHWADHAEDEHTRMWMEKMREKYPVEKIGKTLSLPQYFLDLSIDEMREKVKSARVPEDVLEDSILKEKMRLYDEEFKRLMEELEKIEGGVLYAVVTSPLKKIRNPLSTVLADKYPDRIILIGQPDNGTVSFSLRFQRANEVGAHLGEIAKEAGRLFGGGGGGHPPAAGVTIPREKEPEFRKWIKKRLEGFILSSGSP